MEYNELRMEICKACPHYVPVVSVCSECGCFLPAKTMMKKTSCPLEKWLPKQEEQEGSNNDNSAKTQAKI